MSKISKELLNASGIIPRLKLGMKTDKGVVSTGGHRVKLIADKLVEEVDARTGAKVEYVRYLFEENGQKKKYQTKKLGVNGDLHYLVQALAEIEEGDEVILTMKKNGMKNFIEVLPVKAGESVEVADEDIDHEDNLA